MSPDLSSCDSDSTDSSERRDSLRKVPLEDLRSLMYIYTEACWYTITMALRMMEIGGRTNLTTCLPNLGMLPTESFGIKKSIVYARGGLRAALTTNFDTCAVSESKLLRKKGIVDGVEVERRAGGRRCYLRELHECTGTRRRATK